MFTGLIEEVGKINSITTGGDNMRLEISAPELMKLGIALGDSICVDGCCLTAEELHQHSFSAFASPETLKKTSLGDRHTGDPVNLERSLTLQTLLGGHLVSGHVDETGKIASVTENSGSWEIRVSATPDIINGMVKKGSIAIDGISLTVVDLTECDFSVWIIPETWKRTSLSAKSIGDRVNLETDLIGKYVYRFLETQVSDDQKHRDDRIRKLLEKGGWAEKL